MSTKHKNPLALGTRLARLGTVMTVLAAAAFWFMMAGGFPISHPRFWTNSAIPIGIAFSAILAVAFSWKTTGDSVLGLCVFVGAIWFSAAIASRVVFPITMKWLFIPPMIAGIIILLPTRTLISRSGMIAWFGLLAGLNFGASFVCGMRAPPPSTYPLDHPLARLSSGAASESRSIVINPTTRFFPGSSEIAITWHHYSATLGPRLKFISRSPDGAWIILAAKEARKELRWQMDQLESGLSSATASYQVEDLRATTRVESVDQQSVLIDSRTSLPKPIYTHLNTFTEFAITGHQKLTVSFSPAPDARIDVVPSDYPVGRPLRFAYLGGDGIFRVVEASSAEKGPFKTLASGQLSRDEALTVKFYNLDKEIMSMTFDDWAAQCSTELSPTAGWGVPMNAILFSLEGDKPSSAAMMILTLADTSVGRGYDAVAHSAGTYRNQIRLVARGEQ